MPRIAYDATVDLVTQGLANVGVTAAAARQTAAAIVYAEASGVASHGLIRLPMLADQISSGKIRGDVEPEVRHVGESLVLVNGGLGLGYVAASQATAVVIQQLATTGVVFAAVSNSHHFGVAGLYAEQIAAAGYVGLVMSGTAGAMAPAGGHRPLLGNPPIALACPRSDRQPVVIDVAPAVVARGRVAAAAKRGEQIPADWALDLEGAPTTDAAEAMRGTIRAAGDHKGLAFAMLVDLLMMTTTSSPVPGEVSRNAAQSPDGSPPRLGHVIIGVDPVRLGVTDASDRCERYVTGLTEDGADMRVPGERRRQARQQARTGGVEVEPAILHDLRQRAGA